MYRDEATGKCYPADALMDMGFPLPIEFGEYRGYRYHLVRT